MFKSWLPRRKLSERFVHPWLEVLEDRLVPAPIPPGPGGGSVQTITVNSPADTAAPPAGTVTLRSAITQAESDPAGDTINFAASMSGQTISLTGPLPNLTNGESILGLGAANLTINASLTGNVFNTSSTQQVTISGITLTGGLQTSGGGIYNTGTLQLTNDVITGNSNGNSEGGGSGGAIYNLNGTVELTDDTITDNSNGNGGIGNGGAIYNSEGTVQLTNDTIADNSNGNGGGGNGGAIYNSSSGSIQLTNDVVADNTTGNGGGGNGGAIYNVNANMTVIGSTISGNTAGGGSGGGIYTVDGAVTILNTTIVDNSTAAVGQSPAGQGGGIFFQNFDLTVNDSTIVGNTDESRGGANGIFAANGSFTLNNTIVAGTTANSNSIADVNGTVTSGMGNFIGVADDTLIGIVNGSDGNQIGSQITPIVPQLGPLQDNGGPTPTEAPLAGSRVINQGVSSAIPSATNTDQRGFLRIVGASVDVGAVEYQPPASMTLLTAVPNPATFGQTITLTATVAAAPTSPAPNNVPTENVTFFLNGTSLGTIALDANGVATLPTSAGSTGNFTYSATYSGDVNFTTSTGSLSVQVNPIPTQTALAVSPTQVAVGQSVTLTATVTDNSISVIGSVTFFDGTTTIGSAPVNSGGTATISFTPTTPGAAALGAQFIGGTGFGSSTSSAVVIQVEAQQTVGVFDPFTATWYLRNGNSSGAPDITPFQYGGPGWEALVGDWTGNGQDTIAVVDPSTETWYVKFSNSSGAPSIAPFQYGAPGWFAVAGDWTGDGHDGIAVVDLATATWYIKDSVSAGAPSIAPFQYGEPGWIPVIGDWTGSGHDGIGMFDPTTGMWYLKNSATPGAADTIFQYGMVGGYPVVGDFGNNSMDTVAVVDPSATWYIRFSNTSGAPNITPFQYGATLWTAVAGMWLSPATGQPEFASSYGPGAPALSNSTLHAVVAEALARLSNVGINTTLLNRLASANYEVATLPGDMLAETFVSTDTVEIDATADGWGWFTDASPASDAEYVNGRALPNTPAAQGVDLLTTVLHEMGHLAGLPDLAPQQAGDTLMNDVLGVGQRRVQNLDQIFASSVLLPV